MSALIGEILEENFGYLWTACHGSAPDQSAMVFVCDQNSFSAARQKFAPITDQLSFQSSNRPDDLKLPPIYPKEALSETATADSVCNREAQRVASDITPTSQRKEEPISARPSKWKKLKSYIPIFRGSKVARPLSKADPSTIKSLLSKTMRVSSGRLLEEKKLNRVATTNDLPLNASIEVQTEQRPYSLPNTPIHDTNFAKKQPSSADKSPILCFGDQSLAPEILLGLVMSNLPLEMSELKQSFRNLSFSEGSSFTDILKSERFYPLRGGVCFNFDTDGSSYVHINDDSIPSHYGSKRVRIDNICGMIIIMVSDGAATEFDPPGTASVFAGDIIESGMIEAFLNWVLMVQTLLRLKTVF